MPPEASSPPIAMPAALAAHVAGGTWHDSTGGFTGDVVFRITLPDASAVYLKRAEGPNRAELRREGARLRWLAGRLPAPMVLGEADLGEARFLLSTAVPGWWACDSAYTERVPEVVRRLAEGLRQVHAQPVAECPFDARLAVKLARAEERVRAGLVDLATFDEKHRSLLDARDLDEESAGWGAKRAQAAARRLRPAEPEGDLVVTHGDYCLPNVLLSPDVARVTGLVDWGRAGVADRYHDLAIGLRSLRHNWGPGWEPLFWETYGIADPDEERLAYYELLDELF